MKLKLFVFLFMMFFFGLASAQSCSTQSIKLQVLGSGGPELNDGRVSSSYLIWIEGKARILVDSGAGSAHQFEQSGAKFADIEAILFTHLHVDHSVDLPAFIKGSFFANRVENLPIFGPAGNALMPATTEFLDKLFAEDGVYPYLNSYLNSNKKSTYKIKPTDVKLTDRKIQSFKLNQDIELQVVATHHGPIASVAWRVNIKDCSISFSGDMSNQYGTLKKLAKDSDLLVANNAIEESAVGVARNLHMPPSEIGKIAKQAGVKKLLLAHFMRRSLKFIGESTKIINSYYKGETIIAEDLMTLEF
ncbi:MAG: MBL fold metallo-hydrolase [Proteobacteria bacterium]|nr:MBL fold metallo-hydrolase [Pseudomonadota bacterium]